MLRSKGKVKLTSCLSLLAVGVLLAADNDGVDGDKNSKNTSERSLHNNKHETGDGLGCLAHTQFFDEDQDADNRQDTNDRDGNVDPGTGLEGVWAGPEKHDKEKGFNDELTGSLCETVAVCSSDNTTTSKQEDNSGDEDPPVALLVVLVEHAVLAPDLLVLVKSVRLALHLLELVGGAPDLPSEESQDSSECREGYTSKCLDSP